MRDTPESIVPIATAVVLQGSRSVGPMVVEDLSPQALTLKGPSFGNLPLGDVTLVLSVPGRRDLLRMKGAVAHAEWQRGYCLGASVRLDPLGADLEAEIQDIVARHLERSHMPMVMVLDNGRLETSGMRRFLHTLGRNVVFVQKSLDALWLLERFRDSYSTILVDHAFIRANGPEILPFLHDQYFDKRRVLVRPRSEPAESGLGAMVWSVHGVLMSPWTLDQFKEALGIFPPHPPGTPSDASYSSTMSPLCCPACSTGCTDAWPTSRPSGSPAGRWRCPKAMRGHSMWSSQISACREWTA